MPLDLSRYLDLYVAESREHLSAAREIVARLPDASEAVLLELFRHAHSLKGMAAAMGYARVADVAHAAEDLLDAVRHGSQEPACAAPDLLEALGCIARMIERVARGEPPEDPSVERCLRRLRGQADTVAPSPPSAVVLPRPVTAAKPFRVWRMDFVLDDTGADARRVAALLGALERLGTIRTAAAPSTSGKTGRLMVLLDSDATRETLVTSLAALPGVASFLVRADVQQTPGGGARSRSEGLARVPASALAAIATSAQDLLLEEARAGVEMGTGPAAGRRAARRRRLLARIHAQATELRLEPFDSVAHRLVAAGRQAGTDLGRRVRIEIEGGDLRLERSLLDALVEPLLHVVRNAVDHGIEPPEVRTAAGKPAEGVVRLRLESTGADARITVEDDGRGLDPVTLRAAAVRLGSSSPVEAEQLSDAEALALITRPGFTTAASPGPVSGRGIGMDVVRATVEGLGGTLELTGRPGGGTRITFVLPRSLAARPVLLLRGPEGTLAVPLEAVKRVDSAESAGVAVWLSGPDGREARLVVEEILGRREVVVQPLAAAGRALGYPGAALLEDGAIALVVDPNVFS